MPPVTLVETEARALQVEIPMTVLSDAQVRFKGDSNCFVDTEAAAEVLSDAAAELLKNPNRQTYLVGTTAMYRDGG